MTRELNTTAHYLSESARFERENPRREPSSLGALRRQALERFAETGFPTLRDEEWKYTSVAPLAATPFRVASSHRGNGISAEHLKHALFGSMECTLLVFMNGHYAPELSRPRALPAGVLAGSLAEFLEKDPGRVEPHLARHVSYRDQPFVALNTAFLRDGAFIHVPKRKVLSEPIHLLFVTSGDGAPPVSHPRNLIVVEEGSQVTVVENYVSLKREVGLTNTVTEVVAGASSVVHHCKLQRESEEAFHMATLQCHLERSSSFTSHAISLGGSLVRNDINSVLDAEGAECVLNGLYLAVGRQHMDNHTLIDHARAHCSSREFYKGVLAGASHGVFNGKIRVRPDAQKTDAKQTNKNLLLSEEALVDTKPQLEIHADDVKCTHGATIGQLDEDALFYLRSRGIGRDKARSLLVHAFASDIVERIPVESIRTGLECELVTRLPVGIEARGSA
jgi:Fe-S cluster assembly protein SufD